MVDEPLATLRSSAFRKGALDEVMEQLKTGKGFSAPAGGG